MRNGTTFINEVRSGYGLEPVEWGNVPMNYSQYGIARNPNDMGEVTPIDPSESKSLMKSLVIDRLKKVINMIDIQHERNITNALMLEYLDLWKEFDITSVDDKATRKYYNELMDLISSQLDESIRWINSNEAKEYFISEAKYHENIFNKLETSWDNILNGSYDNVDELLDAIYDKGKELGYKDMREHIHYTKTDKLALQFVKDYNFNLIQRIDDDVRNEIKNKIITGILSGENPNNITPKILNIAEEN